MTKKNNSNNLISALLGDLKKKFWQLTMKGMKSRLEQYQGK